MTENIERLNQEEAEQLAKLLRELQKEMDEQFKRQGLSSEPIDYTVLTRNKYMSYLEQQYGVDIDQ